MESHCANKAGISWKCRPSIVQFSTVQCSTVEIAKKAVKGKLNSIRSDNRKNQQ